MAVMAVSPLGSVSMRMSRRWLAKDAGCDAVFVAVSVVKLRFLSGDEAVVEMMLFWRGFQPAFFGFGCRAEKRRQDGGATRARGG